MPTMKLKLKQPPPLDTAPLTTDRWTVWTWNPRTGNWIAWRSCETEQDAREACSTWDTARVPHVRISHDRVLRERVEVIDPRSSVWTG